MSRDELMKLFDLLDSLCSAGRRAPRDRRGVLAWELALKPYAYEDMKRAALEHAREKAFFPDICELVSRVPKEREEPENGGERGLSVQTVGGRILAGYESSGVPTYMQARGLGMSFSQWSELCRSKGV